LSPTSVNLHNFSDTPCGARTAPRANTAVIARPSDATAVWRTTKTLLELTALRRHRARRAAAHGERGAGALQGAAGPGARFGEAERQAISGGEWGARLLAQALHALGVGAAEA